MLPSLRNARHYNRVHREQISSHPNQNGHDCVAKAIAIVTGESYEIARYAVEEVTGESIDHQGVSCYKFKETLNQILDIFNMKVFDVSDKWYEARTIFTAERHLPTSCNFLCLIKNRSYGHLSAVVDGKVEDWTRGTRRRIDTVYEVVPIS